MTVHKPTAQKIFPRTEFGNPVLRTRAKAVPISLIKKSGFQKLLKQVFFTMRHAQGVGLAAPQIGLPLQLAVIQVAPTKHRPKLKRGEKIVIINPKILWKSKEKIYDWEGCLSFEGARGFVPRHRKIRVQYIDEKGERRERMVPGFLARVFQHEIDHLNGTLYVDRMDDMKTLMTTSEFQKRLHRAP